MSDSRKNSAEITTPHNPLPAEKIHGMIVYRERVLVNGVQMEKIHGPMPVDDWPEYARAHQL